MVDVVAAQEFKEIAIAKLPIIHSFTRTGLARQFEFNNELLNIVRPIVDQAIEGSDVKKDLEKAVSLLTARNELLIVADGDLSVFAFYDQHKKAEVAKDPVIAAFLKAKEKEVPRPRKTSVWKAPRFDPYERSKTPFRNQRSAWAPASLPYMPQPSQFYPKEQGSSRSTKMESRAAPRFANSRDMCFECGRFGHFANECRFGRRSN
ncbi:zinc knuckle [Cooperia oncophora]